MSCKPTPVQQILKLARKTSKDVEKVLAIVSASSDFSKEDRIVRQMTRKDAAADKAVRAARKRIPIPGTVNN
jgi:hypothetical protein